MSTEVLTGTNPLIANALAGFEVRPRPKHDCLICRAIRRESPEYIGNELNNRPANDAARRERGEA